MKKILKFVIIATIGIIIGIGVFAFSSGYIYYKSTINNASLSDKVMQIRKAEYFVPMKEIPQNYKNAVIAVEDHRFEEHGAVDIIAIGRALTSNVKNQELVEGGSTITQQVVKNMYFMEDTEKKNSLDRKIAEILIGINLEKNYSKDEIFELYANNIYFGDGYYCIKDAAKGYFNKKPSEMDLYECTLLAGVPNAPSVYSPTVNPELCRQRQAKVIRSMVKYGYLTQEEADKIDLNRENN